MKHYVWPALRGSNYIRAILNFNLMGRTMVLLLCISMHSQTLNAQSDTLIEKFNKSPSPDQRLIAAFDVARKYVGSTPDTAIKYLRLALQDSALANDKAQVGTCLKGMSVAHYYLGDYESMNHFAKASLKIFEKTGNEINLNSARKNYALSLDLLGKYDQALIIYFQLLTDLIKIKDSAMISGTLNDIGNLYAKTKNFEQSLRFHRKGLAYVENREDLEYIKGNLYNSIGYIYSDLKQQDSAVYYYENALKLKKKNGNAFSILVTLNNLCSCIDHLNETNKSIACFEELLFFQKQVNDTAGISRTYINLANGHSILKRYPRSIVLLDSAKHMLLATGNNALMAVVYKKYASIFFEKGDARQAYLALDKYQTLNDSLTNIAKQQTILELSEKYESRQKEEQIKLLNAQQENNNLIIQKQRWTLISTVLSVAIVSILILILFSSYKAQQITKKEQELKDQKEAERIRISRDMHDDIGAGLTRIVMRSEQLKLQIQHGDDSKSLQVASLEKMADESRELSHNIGEIVWALNPKNDSLDNLFAYIRNYAYDYLDQANISCSFDYPEHMPDAPASPELRRNIFLIVKEALNNIVKHSEATAVEITLSLIGTTFSMTISDNGKGIDLHTESAGGNGMGNLEKRTKESGGTLVLHSEKGLGTSLCVKDIPIENPTKV